MGSLIYTVGQDVPLAVTVLNDVGQPSTAETIVVTVTAPDGTTSTPAVAPASAGVYTAVVPSATLSGTYLVRWIATGTGFAFAAESQFQVRPAGVEQVVDLASVKAHLNMPPTDTSQDDELIGFILAASAVVRDLIGPIIPETHTEFFTGGVGTISLAWQPVIAIANVTEYYGLSAFPLTEQPLGGQMNAFAYTVDYVTGELTRRTFGGQAALFAIGDKNIRVVYTTGRTDLPYNVRLGALELIRHLWQQSQQGARPRFGGGRMDGETHVPIGFAIPDRVVELLSPHRRPPGIA